MRFQRLNMDNSWLLTLGETSLLVDPWLHGTEVDYAGWFNTQWHQTPPLPYDVLPAFDAVLITQKYPDHFHAETLSQLAPKVIFAPASLRKKLAALLPDAQIHLFDRNEATFSWKGLTLSHLPTRRRIDPIYDAFSIEDGTESILFAPHGLNVDELHLETLASAAPCKLLISPFNRYKLPALLGGTVTPGLSGLERLIQAVNPSHVVQTHDELKDGKGLIPALASITVFEPHEAAEHRWLSERFIDVRDYHPIEL